MNSRERVLRAITFQQPDRIPLGYFATPAALVEYGEPLMELLRRHPGDFFETDKVFRVPERDTANYRPDGSYCKRVTDAWGMEWVTFREGFFGEVKGHPLEDWAYLKDYRLPEVPNSSPEGRKKAKEDMAQAKEQFIGWGGPGMFVEIIQGLRGVENFLIDVALDSEELYELADLMLERYHLPSIELALEAGADVIGLSDDWGSQQALLINPEAWRRIFKPRYKRMIDLAHEGGALVWMHSCGHIIEIIPDWIELGLDVINPQLGCMDMGALQRLCDHKLCIYADWDRQQILPHGTPAEIRQYTKDVTNLFASPDGGLMFSAAISPEIPFENIAAVLEAFEEYRDIHREIATG
ncbi:MAG: uroporphyrinogen decarboxylase family protein [Armatimonadota bacterium]